MSTFLLTVFVITLVIAAMAVGVIFGRKPIAGSCGGLGAKGEECEFGCRKPCSERQARLDANAAHAHGAQDAGPRA